MHAFYVIRSGRRRLYVVPFRAIAYAAFSLTLVICSLFLIDRLILPRLERSGVVSGEDWTRHNRNVTREHQRAATTRALPEIPAPLIPAGVCSWKGHPVHPEKTPGTKRILVTGDSFVWGSAYLSLNHMWWRQLGQLLEPYSVEVIAVGRPGASTHDQLSWVQQVVPQYQPDLIIWGYVSNDADEGRVRQIGKSQESIPKLDRVRNMARRIWPQVMSRFDSLRSYKLEKMYTGPRYGYEYSEWELMLVTDENLAVYEQTIRQVKALLDQTAIPGFMMTLPNYPSTEYFAPRFTPIIKVWQQAGIAAHDTIPEFVRRYGEKPLAGRETIQWGINPADGHPGPRACRFLATQALEVLQQNYPQILGEQRSANSQPVINDWLPAFDLEQASAAEPGQSTWMMTYPDESRCPTMPLGIPTPLLALKNPLPLRTLKLAGPGLESARVWLTFADEEEGFDNGIPHELGEQRGTELIWELPSDLKERPISTIRFRATFATSDHGLSWSFPQKAGE